MHGGHPGTDEIASVNEDINLSMASLDNSRSSERHPYYLELRSHQNVSA